MAQCRWLARRLHAKMPQSASAASPAVTEHTFRSNDNLHATSVSAPEARAGFVCPFCGLLCDDIPDPGPASIAAQWSQDLQALCPRAAAGIAAWGAAARLSVIDGQTVDAAAALAAAGERVRRARRLVIGGMGGDVQAARAALALADRAGARVVHRNQWRVQHNLFAMQGKGGVTTTLAEVKQRADLVVLVGGDISNHFPRLLERVFGPAPAFVDAAQRSLVLLGSATAQRLPSGVNPEFVDIGALGLAQAVAILRAGVRPATRFALDGSTVPAALLALAERMKTSRYGVLVWSVATLPEGSSEILVEQLHQLVIELNRSTRWAALPLAGSDGDLSANAVATWQTGFALPLEYTPDGVGYDPYPDYADADLLLWINSLPGVGVPQLPGAPADLPVIVVGSDPWRAAAAPPQHVLLPAAVPGLDAGGHLVRTDSVITLFAPRVRSAALSTAAQHLEQIGAAAFAPQRP